MQARYYDPVIGRFLSVDPVGFLMVGDPGYVNQYAYLKNDPINETDPTGMCGPATPLCVWVVAALGSGSTATTVVAGGAMVGCSIGCDDIVEAATGTSDGTVLGDNVVSHMFEDKAFGNNVENRSTMPGPLNDPTPDANGQPTADAEGRSHSIPGADGGYTTHGETNEAGFPETTKQFRPNAKQPDGGRGANVKERGTNTDGNGKKHPSKSTKRQPRQGEVRKQPQ